MQLEAGKFYQTRDGHKAFVVGVNPFQNAGGLNDFLGAIDLGKGLAKARGWRGDGKFIGVNSADWDLVAEWRDPPTCRQVCERLIAEGRRDRRGYEVPFDVVLQANEALKHDVR